MSLATPSRAACPPHSHPESAAGDAARRVTVIIPTYNRKEKLRDCLLSLLEQDLRGLELTVRVQDDGSSDGTGEMARALLGAYRGPVRLFYVHQENAGPAAARNAALGASDTEWIAFLDDDCIASRSWIRALLDGFTGPRIAAVGGKCRPGAAPTRVARYFSYRGANEYPSKTRPFEFPLGGNCMYRRDVLRQFDGFDTRFREAAAEDMDLAWRVKQSGQYEFAHAAEAVVLDHNIETVSELVSRALDRGREKSLKRWVRGGRGAPSWPRLAREGAALLFHSARALFLPLQALQFLTRGVSPGDSVSFALLDALYRVVLRWARFAMMLELLAGQRHVEAASRPATAPMEAPGPAGG